MPEGSTYIPTMAADPFIIRCGGTQRHKDDTVNVRTARRIVAPMQPEPALTTPSVVSLSLSLPPNRRSLWPNDTP